MKRLLRVLGMRFGGILFLGIASCWAVHRINTTSWYMMWQYWKSNIEVFAIIFYLAFGFAGLLVTPPPIEKD